ncbi:MAG TPA: DUF1924 domain-containing protein [Aquimonas sp.]|jgi:hypothetical protein|nr:DUF1924 domain-containing protein [Aquimonas sp.]
MFRLSAIALLMLVAQPGYAADAQSYLQGQMMQAREAQADFVADPDRGARFFRTAQGEDWRCSSCHTEDPRQAGEHITTGKAIEALSPLATPSRFTDVAKTDKWFRRNCGDVVGRECTAAEKADVIAFLLQPAR